jgi:type IV secretory pathway VirB2 component (pilin)
VGDVTRAVQLGQRVELVLVEPGLFEGAVDLLAYPPVAAVNDVVDLFATGQLDRAQVVLGVVLIGRRAVGALGFLEIARGVVGVVGVAVAREPVLVVVGAGGGAVRADVAGAVAFRALTVYLFIEPTPKLANPLITSHSTALLPP